MSPSTGKDTRDGAQRQAEAWLARLDSPECDARERAAFEAWLAQSPEHIDAYLQAERVHALAAALAGDELLRAAARRERRRAASSWRRPQRWLASAAVLLVAIGAAVLWRPHSPPAQVQQFATAAGELRQVALADGTRLWLDAGSAVETRYGEERVVELRRGRIQVDVAADPGRPFRVRAGASTIRDIGTVFQVSRRGEAVDVGLLEGEVEVSVGTGAERRSSRLRPGEQVAIDPSGRLQPKRPLDLAVAQAWPRGDLVFKQRRLDELLAEMNRYSPVQLRLADPALGALTVSGVFHAGDQDALVAALEQGWSLRAERVGEREIVLHPPRR